MLHPILSAAVLADACRRFSMFLPRSLSAINYILVERGEGRVILAARSETALLLFCHLPAPLPRTALQGALLRHQWDSDAGRFLVPLPDLRRVRDSKADAITLTPTELRCKGVVMVKYHAPSELEFPPLPPLDTIPEGWTTRELHPVRVDVRALAALADE